MQTHYAISLLRCLPWQPSVLRLKLQLFLPALKVLMGEQGQFTLYTLLLINPHAYLQLATLNWLPVAPYPWILFHSSMPLPTLCPLPGKPFPTCLPHSATNLPTLPQLKRSSMSSAFTSFPDSVSSIPWFHLWSRPKSSRVDRGFLRLC